jgi:nitroimidazol reductase NimA-like FMN-containing flavoprotein (pyridoxamine 5'-phosphate oxidase superfamily)
LSINMKEDEIKVFLAENKICRMATADNRGIPHVVPMWYVILDDCIFIETTGSTKKVRNIEKNDNVSIVIDRGEFLYDYRGVIMQGKMEFVKDEDLIRRFREAFAQRFFGSDQHPGYKALTSIPHRVVLKFFPQKVASWDYRKMSF